MQEIDQDNPTQTTGPEPPTRYALEVRITLTFVLALGAIAVIWFYPTTTYVRRPPGGGLTRDDPFIPPHPPVFLDPDAPTTTTSPEITPGVWIKSHTEYGLFKAFTNKQTKTHPDSGVRRTIVVDGYDAPVYLDNRVLYTAIVSLLILLINGAVIYALIKCHNNQYTLHDYMTRRTDYTYRHPT